MNEDLDPAQLQEGAADDATTTTDPLVEEDDAESTEKSEEGAASPQDDQEKQGEDEGELEIVVDGAKPPPEQPKEAAAPWVKELRKEHRELKTKLAEAERKLQSQAQPEKAADPGQEPTLENSGWDEAALKQRHAKWLEATARKKADDDRAAQQAAASQTAFQSKFSAYAQSRETLVKRIPDYVDREAVVTAKLDKPRQQALIHYAEDPAKVVYALAQDPDLLEDLSKEADLGRLVAKIAKLEAKVTTRKKAQSPPPERPVRGSGAPAGADSQLEKLRAHAEKTKNYEALLAYKDKLRRAKR